MTINEHEMRELLELTRDNNQLLRKMRRHAIFGNVTRLIYWAVILGVPVMLYYYFLQPYLGQIIETYDGIQSGVEGIQDINTQVEEVGGFSELLKKIGL